MKNKILIVSSFGMPSSLVTSKIMQHTDSEVVVISPKEAKEMGITITNEPPSIPITPYPIEVYQSHTPPKDGKQLRRERRKQQRRK